MGGWDEDCLMAGLQSPSEHEELGIARRMRGGEAGEGF